MYPLLSLFSDWSLLVLRLVLGLVFLIHGWPKIKSPKTTANNFSMMGFRPGYIWGPLVAVVEFFGGAALILGFYVQVAALFFVGEFLVINVWKIAKRQPFVGGFEFDLLILAVAITLLTLGGGMFSLDRYFFFGSF